ncbi:MAG: trypsin-like peptidase domain-containing protein [Candidatus Micrarchaeota archaeon]
MKIPKAALLPAAIVLVLVAIIILTAAQPARKGTHITVSADVESLACSGNATVFAELRDSAGKRVGGRLVTFLVGSQEVDSLYTDSNGRVWLETPLGSGWCGRSIDFVARFDGDGSYLPSSGRASAAIRLPTSLELELPDEAEAGQNFTASATLRDRSGMPLAGKVVTAGGANATTGSNGTAVFVISFAEAGKEMLAATFPGDAAFEPSASSGIVQVRVPACADGTEVGECSGGYLCGEDRELAADCGSCGCPNGLLCIEDACISEEERLQMLIDRLQMSNVKIESDEGIGSGVIIARNGTSLIILTNRHVVDADFAFVPNTDIEVLNYNNETARPARIYVAPNQLDMALIFVNKDLGPPADIDYGLRPKVGSGVLAIGTPLGIPNSVSMGIISNYAETNTSSGFSYDVIQTDAAVNPGNSGGGVYLSGSGKLIGIISFKLVIRGNQLAEGLGFAIPVKVLEDYPLGDWKAIAPIEVT